MADPAVLQLHEPGPLDAVQLAANLNLLIDRVNRLGQLERFQVPDASPAVVSDGDQYRVVGTLLCESLTVSGATAVVAEDRVATLGRRGLLVKGASVAPLGTLSGPVETKVDAIGAKVQALMAALIASGQMAGV